MQNLCYKMQKKVRFNLTPEVHLLIHWSYAYKSARKKYWEFYALDRFRFRNRIKNMDRIISPILNNQHRQNIYERFI